MNNRNNANVRNTRDSILHLTMLTSIVAAALGSTITPAQDDTHRPGIPFCDDSKYDHTIGRRLLYVTTLDGRLSALDITKGGKLHWSINTSPGPLISSSIHRLELTNNGQFVRMIPSLSGGIYKFDGESIDPIPITTENLLSSSAKFSDDLVISGGKETRTYGVSARTGKILYECSMHGCLNATDAEANSTNVPGKDSNTDGKSEYYGEHNPEVDDVIVVRRQTQTVRAVESRTGTERWNFSVGQHELNLLRSEDCHTRHFSDMDMAILDLDVKVIVPEGIICAYSKSNPNVMLWKYKFDHPIVSGWKIGASDELEAIDMFGSAQWLWDQDDHIFESPHPSTAPSIYLGMYEKQLYIQESLNLRHEIMDQSNLYTHLTATESNLPKIPWRPIAASSNSLIIFQDDKIISDGGDNDHNGMGGAHNSQNENDVHGYELMPYDDDNFALSAQSVLNASEFVNGNGFYLYTNEALDKHSGALCDNDKQVVPAIKDVPARNGTNRTIVSEDVQTFNLDDIDAPVKVVILSLWFWWKEITIIAFTTALIVNFVISHRQRPEREIVVIERHIPVPTAIEATEASTVALLGPTTNSSSKSTSNGVSLSGRTFSESTTHSGEHFSSRFQDDFDLLRCLGRGGFGVVFEAKNKLDDCKYAVKRITLPNKKESRDRVMREVKTLANCEHQNIVRYFQAWVETPPPGWQEEEDSKWLAHELSTSIQIETPDGTTLPSFENSLIHDQHLKGKLHMEKKKQLLSWVSSVTSIACSSDHGSDNEIEEIEEEDDEDEDSCIVFRSESQSMALQNGDDSLSSTDEVNCNGINKKSSTSTLQSDKVTIDIHSNSSDRSPKRNGKNIDYSELSDSFQIEFVRSANGDVNGIDDIDDTTGDADKSGSNTSRKSKCCKFKNMRKPLSLDLTNDPMNHIGNGISKALVPAVAVQIPPPKALQNKVYLYIQMQLCRKECLRDWLRENKTEARQDHIAIIFHQIVDAVDYVHLKGLIHRDLKPSNIFFSQDGQIKIGDFGLVTDMSEIPNMITKCGDRSGLPSCARHTAQVGTHLYMSPEQLHGKRYDFKVDIYSLGLIFFELLVYFGTEMERIKTLRDLRDGRYPDEFPVKHPEEYNLLQQMLSPNPEERPSSVELKQQLSSILKLPELVGDSELATLAEAVRRMSRNRTFSSSE